MKILRGDVLTIRSQIAPPAVKGANALGLDLDMELARNNGESARLSAFVTALGPADADGNMEFGGYLQGMDGRKPFIASIGPKYQPINGRLRIGVEPVRLAFSCPYDPAAAALTQTASDPLLASAPMSSNS